MPGTDRGPISGADTLGLIVRGLFVLVLGAAGGWAMLIGYTKVPEVTVPMLVGQTADEAEALAGRAHVRLDVVEERHHPTAPNDVIYWQDPAPGRRVKQGRVIAVAVSEGQRIVTMPDLAGQSLRDAALLLEARPLKIGEIRETFDEVIGTRGVVRQEPPPGAQLVADTPVTIVLSKGPPPVPVPRVIGLPLGEALRVLRGRGLHRIGVRSVETSDRPEGIVIGQTPWPGRTVKTRQSWVTIEVAARPQDPWTSMTEQQPPSGRGE